MSRSSLQTYIDANLTTNGAQGITGAELDTFLTDFLADSVLVSEVDGSTLEYVGNVLRIKDAGVTLAKMASLAQSTIVGRAAGAGTGVPTALTATQTKTLLAIGISDVASLQASLDAKADLAGATFTGSLVIASAAPILQMSETDQTDPVGRWRWVGVSGDLYLQRSTGAGFASASNTLRVTTTDGLLINGGTAWHSGNDGSGSGLDAGLLEANNAAFYRDAGNLNAGSILAARIASATITLAMMANLAQATIIGRASGAGTGVPTALTAGQVSTILGLATVATSGSAADLGSGTLPSGRLNTSYTSIVAITMSDDLFMSSGTASIRQTTSDAADNKTISLAGGGAVGTGRGGYMAVYGNEHASLPGRLQLIAGDTAAQLLIQGGAAAATTLIMRNNTAAGLDSGSLALSPAGALTDTSRGAYLNMYGNEHATQGGNILFQSGTAGMVLANNMNVGVSTLTNQGLGHINISGGLWYSDNRFPNYQTSAANANITLTCVAPITIFYATGTLTANRTLTVATTNAQAGWMVFMKRTGGDTGGPWGFNVNSGLIPSWIVNSFNALVYTGSAWVILQ